MWLELGSSPILLAYSRSKRLPIACCALQRDARTEAGCGRIFTGLVTDRCALVGTRLGIAPRRSPPVCRRDPSGPPRDILTQIGKGASGYYFKYYLCLLTKTQRVWVRPGLVPEAAPIEFLRVCELLHTWLNQTADIFCPSLAKEGVHTRKTRQRSNLNRGDFRCANFIVIKSECRIIPFSTGKTEMCYRSDVQATMVGH